MRILAVLTSGSAACGVEVEPMECMGAQHFAIGMTVTSTDGRTVTLEAADPAPVDVGENRWTLGITTVDGAPATGLSPMVRPFMPMHGHGLDTTHFAGTEAADGSYIIEVFDLIMPGLWEFHVELSDDDVAMFALCAEG